MLRLALIVHLDCVTLSHKRVNNFILLLHNMLDLALASMGHFYVTSAEAL